MVPRMKSNANERKRPVYAGDITDEDAVRILKDEGIWERLLDGKHTLRYIYSGIIEEDHLELDAQTAMLKTTATTHDAIDLPYIAFTMYPGANGSYDDWYEEGSPAFAAMMRLMEGC